MKASKLFLVGAAMSGLLAGAAARVSAVTVGSSTKDRTAVGAASMAQDAGLVAGVMGDDKTKKDKNACKGKDGCPAADPAKKDGKEAPKDAPKDPGKVTPPGDGR